jgi:transcription antitermination factor NusG
MLCSVPSPPRERETFLMLGPVTERAVAWSEVVELQSDLKGAQLLPNSPRVTEQSARMESGMQLIAEATDWYAFRVRSRHEKLVSASLRGKGYEEFLPLSRSKRRWADRSKTIEMPLFPGYIFCDTERSEIGKIRCTPGIVDVIRAGSTPLPASRCEIEGLRKAMEAELPLENWPYIDPSTTGHVRITSGPLTGLDGVLVEVRGKERLILSVDLLRRSVLVELPFSAVTVCAEPGISLPDTSGRFSSYESRGTSLFRTGTHS